MVRLFVTSVLVATLLSSAAAADDNHWLAVGHGGQRMLSSDGKAWTQVGSWSKPAHNQDDLNVAATSRELSTSAAGISAVD
jgi:opacity protein-like surface antigen